MDDVVDYWEQVKKLGERGLTLHDAMKERWPETGWDNFEEFSKQKSKEWHGVDEQFLKELHGAFKSRWDEKFIKMSKTNKPLIELCNRRISELSR
jgi:hypothetical protein